MPLRAQAGLPRRREIFEFLTARNHYHLGVYADVVSGGTVDVGAPVTRVAS